MSKNERGYFRQGKVYKPLKILQIFIYSKDTEIDIYKSCNVNKM